MGINLLVPALLVFYSAAAQAPPIWNGLQPGRHGAGVSVSTAGGLPITVWYPSSAAGKPVTLAGFVTSAASFADEAGVDGLPAEIITRYASQPLFATADAPAAAGKFPLVVVAQGNQQRPLHQAVIAEYLASHGFVVVTAISTTVSAPMKTAEDVGPAAQREAEQLEKLAAFGRTLPYVDGTRVFVLAHSFGARAALLFAMHDPSVAGLVSLDGGIGTAQSMDSYRKAPWFSALQRPVAILHLYETLDDFMKPEFSMLRSAVPSGLTLRKVDGLHHVHFTTLGFAAAVDPALGQAVHLEAGGPAALRTLAEDVGGFLIGRLRR